MLTVFYDNVTGLMFCLIELLYIGMNTWLAIKLK